MKNKLKCPECGKKPKLSRVFVLPGGLTACLTRLGGCGTELRIVKRNGAYVARRA